MHYSNVPAALEELHWLVVLVSLSRAYASVTCIVAMNVVDLLNLHHSTDTFFLGTIASCVYWFGGSYVSDILLGRGGRY